MYRSVARSLIVTCAIMAALLAGNGMAAAQEGDNESDLGTALTNLVNHTNDLVNTLLHTLLPVAAPPPG